MKDLALINLPTCQPNQIIFGKYKKGGRAEFGGIKKEVEIKKLNKILVCG